MSVPNHYIKRRDLLHSERTPQAALAQTADEFFAAERYSEALDFYEKAKHRDGIQKIKQVALKNGDTFLLARLERHDRNLITREEWEAAARTAEVAGRASMAVFVAKKFAAPPVPGASQPSAIALPGAAPLDE